MAERIEVLLLEDNPGDAGLVDRVLREDFPEASVEHADCRERYLERLRSKSFDLVIADGSVPGCVDLESFRAARAIQPGIGFIYLSGLDDPDRDLRGMQALGISDFLWKGDLAALAPAVRRALQDRTPQDAATLLAGYERLVAIVRELSMARDLEAILTIVRRGARELTGADGATFVLREGDLCHYADEDAIGPLWKGQRFPMHSCISGWAMTHRQPAIVEDIFEDPRIPVAAYEPTFVRSVVMVPIRAADPIGAIGNYWAERRVPGRAEVSLLQALADTTAVAMENVRIYSELEDRVRERTRELESFAYAVSHDLRAPLWQVRGYAGLMRKRHATALGREGLEDLDQIFDATHRMGDMIDGLLELSRTMQAPVDRRSLDLADLAREVAGELEATTGRAVELVAPATLPVEGDPVLLRIVLYNLLGNAWKFTTAVEEPRVEIGVQPEAGSPDVYFVRDNGAGFEARYAERLFEVFQRLHPRDAYPGLGVGLATVRRIIQKHGGKVWATGAPGDGATFFFTLEGVRL